MILLLYRRENEGTGKFSNLFKILQLHPWTQTPELIFLKKKKKAVFHIILKSQSYRKVTSIMKRTAPSLQITGE